MFAGYASFFPIFENVLQKPNIIVLVAMDGIHKWTMILLGYFK